MTAGKREAWGWCCPQGASGGPASRGRCGLRHSSCAAGRVETGLASLASCPHPSQACLPGTQHGLHFLPAFHPNPILLPSSESRRRRRNLYAHCADEETESYRGKKRLEGTVAGQNGESLGFGARRPGLPACQFSISLPVWLGSDSGALLSKPTAVVIKR